MVATPWTKFFYEYLLEDDVLQGAPVAEHPLGDVQRPHMRWDSVEAELHPVE
jgi:hypothetical protein